METYVLSDLRVMTIALLVGILLGLVYVLISLLRRLVKAGTVITAISDTLFGILAAIVIFTFTFLFNNGALRAYVTVPILLGLSISLLSYRKLSSIKRNH
jgi:hypothetical protein